MEEEEEQDMRKRATSTAAFSRANPLVSRAATTRLLIVVNGIAFGHSNQIDGLPLVSPPRIVYVVHTRGASHPVGGESGLSLPSASPVW